MGVRASARSGAADGASAAGSGGAANESVLLRAHRDWEATSSGLCNSATLPFVFLLLPQVILNTQNMLGSNVQALAALSWVVRTLID